ncbi:MAG: hypothetical protein JKY98_05015 [Gammaproteobacteria bacterium]|nr:hypothetical protein [Gammaproteobacteria bacterium]
MNRVLAVLQLALAVILLVIAFATVVNMIFIAFRPESISVVNVFVGQTVMLVCLFAFSRIMFRKGKVRLSSGQVDSDSDESAGIEQNDS